MVQANAGGNDPQRSVSASMGASVNAPMHPGYHTGHMIAAIDMNGQRPNTDNQHYPNPNLPQQHHSMPANVPGPPAANNGYNGFVMQQQSNSQQRPRNIQQQQINIQGTSSNSKAAPSNSNVQN